MLLLIEKGNVFYYAVSETISDQIFIQYNKTKIPNIIVDNMKKKKYKYLCKFFFTFIQEIKVMK